MKRLIFNLLKQITPAGPADGVWFKTVRREAREICARHDGLTRWLAGFRMKPVLQPARIVANRPMRRVRRPSFEHHGR